MTSKQPVPVPQPTESEAIVAALRSPQNPKASQAPPVALPVDVAGNSPVPKAKPKQT
jgi:hypothetical protein